MYARSGAGADIGDSPVAMEHYVQNLKISITRGFFIWTTLGSRGRIIKQGYRVTSINLLGYIYHNDWSKNEIAKVLVSLS